MNKLNEMMEEDQSLAIKEIDNIKDLSEEVLKLQQLEKNIKAKELDLKSLKETAGKISGEAVYYPPEINYSNAGLGDVNLDGSLNVLDVVLLANAVLDNSNLTDEQEANADFNNDDSLNVLDVVLLVNEALSGSYTESGDMNNDGILNVLDIVLLVNEVLG